MNLLQRRALLVDLIKLRRPIELIHEELSWYGWDSPEVVLLRAADVVEILDRFLDGQLAVRDLETWADVLEGRDDVDYEEVKDVIWELANPTICQALGREQVLALRDRLTTGG